MRERFLILFLFLSGCMGPAVGPDLPDNTDKADPALVQECRLAFGEFGKTDAVHFGNLYLAYSDLIVKDKKCNTVSDAMSWLQEAREIGGMGEYPSFVQIGLRETSDLKENAQLDAETREQIAKVFKRIGLAAREAGR